MASYQVRGARVAQQPNSHSRWYMAADRKPAPRHVRGSRTIAQLAAELGSTPDEILQIAKRHRVWAKSANTVLRPAEVSSLREFYAFETLRQRVRDKWRRESLPEQCPEWARGPVATAEGEEAFASLGLPPPKARRVGTSARPKRARADEPELTGTAKFVKERWPRYSVEMARATARAWADAMVTGTDVIKWLSAGLQPDDAELAARLAELVVKPDLLQVSVHGRTVLSRIADDGAYPEDVARLLRTARLID